jgi:L-fucose mutarotase
MIDVGNGLTHPGILSCLARAGHFSRIIVADGNFPASVRRGPHTEIFHLGWRKGTPTVTEVLDAMLPLVRPQKAIMMQPSPDALPSPVQDEVRRLLGDDVPVEHVDRWDFYALADDYATAGIIVTGDDRRFANLVLEMGPVL